MMLQTTLIFSLLAVASARWETKPHMSNVDSDTPIGGSSDTFDPNPPEPAVPGCVVENSFFGDTSESSAFVEFVYEVETVQEPTATMDRIIGALEIAIAEKALPTLFGEGCEGRRVLRRRLAATGVSTLPTDEPIDGLTCEVAMENNINPCTVVDGVFTIYTDGADDGLIDQVLSAITTAGNNGDFNDAHEDIVRVSVVAVTPDGAEGGASGIPNSPPPVDDGNRSYIYVAVAAGAVFVIGAAVFYKRRQSQSNVDADETILTPSLNQQAAVAADEAPTSGREAYDLSTIM